jgi:hypothetical protein
MAKAAHSSTLNLPLIDPRYGRAVALSYTPEYGVWESMKSRCQNPKCWKFANYGGRGIKVCERWQSFENFYADMRLRPSPHHSIDRIDNDGNYEPGNCRWATQSEQNKNRRKSSLI